MDTLQLENWFERLCHRVESSPLGQQDWVREGLAGLEALKDECKPLLEQDPWPDSLTKLYEQLSREVGVFLDQLAREEGPTSWAWFNEPWQSVRAFLEGFELREGIGDLFDRAYQKALEWEGSLGLQEQLRQLMLWSQGHVALSGLELQEALQNSASLMVAEESRAGSEQLDLAELLARCRQAEPEEQVEWLRQFVAGLEGLDGELAALEEQAQARPELQLDLEWLFAYLSKLYEIAEAETPNLDALERNFEKLRQEWQKVSQVLLSARLEEPETGQLTQALHVQGVVAAFQQGSLDYVSFLEELRGHHQRLQQVTPELMRAFQREPERQNQLRHLDTTLKALASIRSPGDPNLESLCAAYCEGLESLAS